MQTTGSPLGKGDRPYFETAATASNWGAARSAAGRVRQEVVMKASVGDRIIVRGHKVGEHDRDGEVIEVRGEDGGPPYQVRWAVDGHESLFFPGSDAVVHHFEAEPTEG